MPEGLAPVPCRAVPAFLDIAQRKVQELRDGFYVLRSTVAGYAGTEELSEYRHLYLEVRRGQATPIDFDRWVTHSNASQMRSAR